MANFISSPLIPEIIHTPHATKFSETDVILNRDDLPMKLNNRSRPNSPEQDDDGVDSYVPYRDSPEDGEEIRVTRTDTEVPLPNYEPMYDYLRRQNALCLTTASLAPLSASSRPLHDITRYSSSSPYTDEPLLINFAGDEAPPPSYDNLHQQHEFELRSLRRIFDNQESDTVVDIEEGENYDDEDDDGLQIEDLVKWVVLMLMISLMVAFIGTLFDWGRSPPLNSALPGPC